MANIDTIKAGRITKNMTFEERVWALTARIPEGHVVTYGDLAHRLDSRAYRAVGAALGRNPHAPDVPCHRVVGSTGRLTGFARGLAAKKRLLESEGVEVENDRVDLRSYRTSI